MVGTIDDISLGKGFDTAVEKKLSNQASYSE